MKDATALIDALAGLAWPLFASVVLWRLLPEIKNIFQNRHFTIKVGDNELTVQQFSDGIVETTADIQERLVAVSGSDQGDGARDQSEQPQSDVLRRILWVDDNPSGNAYMAAQFEALGLQVVQVVSTTEGIQAMDSAQPPFDAVLSDMGRTETARYNSDAGLDLIHAIRGTGDTTPIFVCSNRRTLARKDEILAAGANGVTRSRAELFAMLREVGRFPGAAAS
jgi:CheY-like chemotaxis protein